MFHVVKSNAHRTRRRNRRTSDCFFLYSSPIYLYAPISPYKKRLHMQSWRQQAFDAPYSLILEEAEPSDWQHSVITVMGGCLKLYSTRLMPMHWVPPTEKMSLKVSDHSWSGVRDFPMFFASVKIFHGFVLEIQSYGVGTRLSLLFVFCTSLFHSPFLNITPFNSVMRFVSL